MQPKWVKHEWVRLPALGLSQWRSLPADVRRAAQRVPRDASPARARYVGIRRAFDGLQTATLCYRNERSLLFWKKSGRGKVVGQPFVMLSVQARIFATQAVAPVLNARHNFRPVNRLVINAMSFREVRVVCLVERSCDGRVRPITVCPRNGAVHILAKCT